MSDLWHAKSVVSLCGLGEFMSSLVNHPEYKLLSLRNIPQMSSTSLAYSVFSWPSLLKHLRQMLIANARMEEGERSYFCLHLCYTTKPGPLKNSQTTVNETYSDILILQVLTGL